MGCKGSKKSSSSFTFFGFKRKIVKQTEIVAFATDIHPARARLNKNAYNRFNIDDFFKADIGGKITYRTPTPRQTTTVADRIHDIDESDMEVHTSGDNSLLIFLTKSMTNLNDTEEAEELSYQSCDPDVVAIQPNNTPALEPSSAFKLPGVCTLDGGYEYGTVPSKETELKRKRPKAPSRYREPRRQNRPVIPDIASLKTPGDADEQDDQEGHLFDVVVLPNRNDENISQDERVSIDGCSCNTSSEDNVCISKHRNDGPVRVKRVRPNAAKGERKIPLFHRFSAPTQPPVPSPDTTEKLVIEDLEWDDVAV